MPIYELDGKQYSLPDDVTHDEALKFISSQVGSASSQQPVPSSEQPNVAQQPKPNTGYLGNIDNAMTAHENSVGQQLTQPEKYPGQHVLQTINGVLSYPGVVAGAALSPLKPLAKGIIEGNAFAGGSNANANGLGQSIATMTQPIAQAAQKYPAVQAGLDVGQLGVNVAGLGLGKGVAAGLPGAAAETAGTALQAAGNTAEKTFTNAIVGELGLLKPLAKKLGPTMSEAKDNLASTIQKYNLSDVRGFGSASSKADALAAGKTQQADNLVNQFAMDNPTGEKYDISKDIFKDIKSNITDYVRPGEEPQALSVLKNIEESVTNRLQSNGYGPGRTVPIDQLVEVKRSLNPRFANKSIADDPVKEKMYETSYLKMMDAINEKVPEAGALNKEARDIWLAKDAMEEAAGRNDKLTNTIFGTAIGAAGTTGIVTHPQLAIPIAAASVGAELARRGITQGRALSAGIAASRGLKNVGTAISDIVK